MLLLCSTADTSESAAIGNSFIMPGSRPKRCTIKKTNPSLSRTAATLSIRSEDSFSPPPRPATGTPRPKFKRYLRTTPDTSLSHSTLSKKLLLAVTCGSSSNISGTAMQSGGTMVCRKGKPMSFSSLSQASTPNGYSGGPTESHASISVGMLILIAIFFCSHSNFQYLRLLYFTVLTRYRATIKSLVTHMGHTFVVAILSSLVTIVMLYLLFHRSFPPCVPTYSTSAYIHRLF